MKYDSVTRMLTLRLAEIFQDFRRPWQFVQVHFVCLQVHPSLRNGWMSPSKISVAAFSALSGLSEVGDAVSVAAEAILATLFVSPAPGYRLIMAFVQLAEWTIRPRTVSGRNRG